MRMLGTNFAVVFQLLNIAIIVGIVYMIFYLAVRVPRDLRETNAKLGNIKKMLDEINKKIDK